ncbi:antitoxin Xre-like helix-turn-helix domain-containing protein [Halopseudomonas laoshanensis]|jgi:hypothetical protein|uniref:antitoxin Xre-like helix-turn-helix domain-containing protein n=1 Tax=Halopseudomonas TaxID=2901189 RepID=UPI00373501F0
MRNIKISTTAILETKGAIGLRSAIKIMEHWGASQNQMIAVLRVSRRKLTRAGEERSEIIKLDTDQLDRISYVLNMHATLRIIFDNPSNVYGFMSMPNGNAFFNGRNPLEVIADGSLMSLHETFRRVDGLRCGGW